MLKRFYMQYSSTLSKCMSLGFNFDINHTCAPENVSFYMCFCCKLSGLSVPHCLVIKILLLSPSVSFILYTACCYIHVKQSTQLILPECFSFSLPHFIFSSIHLPFPSRFWQIDLRISQSSPAVPFCLPHTATTVGVSS